MKPVNMLDSKTKTVVKQFASVKEAATYVVNDLGMQRKEASVRLTISRICNHEVCKRCYYGYGWEFGK